MPRTTLTIDDDLLRRLESLAASQGRTLQAVVNDLLRQALAAKRPPFKLELEGWQAALQPGADIFDRDRLFDVEDR